MVAWESDILTARIHEKIQVSTCEIRSPLRPVRITSRAYQQDFLVSSLIRNLLCVRLIFDFMVTIYLFFHFRDHTVHYQRKRCQARFLRRTVGYLLDLVGQKSVLLNSLQVKITFYLREASTTEAINCNCFHLHINMYSFWWLIETWPCLTANVHFVAYFRDNNLSNSSFFPVFKGTCQYQIIS